MIRYRAQKPLSFDEFDTPFEQALNPENRWVRLAERIPWHDLAESYYLGSTSHTSRPAKDARLVIGAVIIKHKLCLSDEETVRQMRCCPPK